MQDDRGVLMDDNQLGRNIQHLREIHNETLDELGNVIHCAKSVLGWGFAGCFGKRS